MAHVTLIHGIANKPAADQLLGAWLDYLAADGGLDLRAHGVSSTMVYWADVLYPEPLPAVEAMAEAVAGAGPVGDGLGESGDAPAVPTATTEESAFLAGLAMKFGAIAAEADAAAAAGGSAEQGLEAIPLPWSIKKRIMETYLRDVHHYLFNVQFSPRPGDTYMVQEEIRRRMIAALQDGASRPGPHVVVSHSMGTVIAYDCLKRVDSCPSVDGLMTVGSPLGLDEVQDQLQPGWSGNDGFPRTRLTGEWVNVYDRLDPVAGFDANLANDFLDRGSARVTDINEQNFGRWRHDIAKYFRGKKLRAALARLLGLDSTVTEALATSPADAASVLASRSAVTWSIPLQVTLSFGKPTTVSDR